MKRKDKISRRAFSPPFILLLVVLGGSVIFLNQLFVFLKQSPTFRVKIVALDPSLQFINQNDLVYLIGKNIFEVDLRQVQRRLLNKYSQLSHLKVVRQYPDRIFIEAKKRSSFAQMRFKNRIVIVDQNGVVVTLSNSFDEALPLIEGVREQDKTLKLGWAVAGKEIQEAMAIIKAYVSRKPLATRFRLKSINVENPSLIYFMMDDNLKIIIDGEEIEEKIEMLSLILSQRNLDLAKVRYLDLRFHEPVIGQR